MQFAAVPIVLHVPPHPITADFITMIVFGEESSCIRDKNHCHRVKTQLQLNKYNNNNNNNNNYYYYYYNLALKKSRCPIYAMFFSLLSFHFSTYKFVRQYPIFLIASAYGFLTVTGNVSFPKTQKLKL
jgi:hypothetical protein